MKRILVSVMMALLWLATPALAAPSPAPDPGPPPQEVTAWFAERALASVRSHAADAFPDASLEAVSHYTIGNPVRVSTFAQNVPASQSITVTNRWIAPIFDGGTAIGALSVNFDQPAGGEEIIRRDARLGSAVTAGGASVAVIYDSGLQAWFLLNESAIEPADEAAANIVLGSIPLNDFLAQRQRIIQNTDTSTPAPAQTTPASEPESHNVLMHLVRILIALAVVIGSLVWLRWDQHTDDPQEDTPEVPHDDLGHVERKGIIGKREAKVRFRSSAGKVSVYKTPPSEESTQ
ncbi:hypothetical protein [Trueperella sp. LYQ143]|uniref:hypothetical protein n=1 Tax=unclassified Trueperella TaxID=2630174 RepID=UPI003983B646